MFQQRHFEAIAQAMQDLRAACITTRERRQQTQVERRLADLFARGNPRFNRDRFFAACMPGANVSARKVIGANNAPPSS